MAIWDSVTVSIAEAMIGILTEIDRVIFERMSASPGNTSERPGLIRTSSKVSASRGFALLIVAIANSSPKQGLGPDEGIGCLGFTKNPPLERSPASFTARFWVGGGR